jgi:hypothetical protein
LITTSLPAPSLGPASLARGVCRSLAQRGFRCLVEFPLSNGRRADVLALGKSGDFMIVEIKSTVADFRSDRKWQDYQAFADRFAFAVPHGFPTALVPDDCGLILADSFGAEVLRDGRLCPLGSNRRRSLTLSFARIAGARLYRTLDPEAAHFAEP